MCVVNSGVIDFCSHLALALQFAYGPCALARLPTAHRDVVRRAQRMAHFCWKKKKKSGFWSIVARCLCYDDGTEA